MKKKSTIKWIIGCFKRHIPAIIAISLLSSLISVCSVGLIMVSRNILNDAQAHSTDSLYKNVIFLGGLLLLQIIANVIKGITRAHVSGKMDMSLKSQLYKHLIKKDYSSLTRMHSGEVVNRFTSDVDVVVSGFSSIIPNTISIFTKLLAGIGAVLFLNPYVALVIVAVGFVFPLLGRLLSNKYKYLHKEAQRTGGVIRSFLQESVQNIIVIKTFLANNPVKAKLSQLLKDNFKIKIKRNAISVTTHTALYAGFSLGYYGILIWGAFEVASGKLGVGTLFAFIELVAQLRHPLQNVSGLLPQYYSMIASAERLEELEDLPEEAKPLDIDANELYSRITAISGKNISFGYEGREVIKDSDFTIKKGSICAVMGESGTGKSTLLRLLLGLYTPDNGTLVLETDGEDIPLDSTVRRIFSYVPQGDLILSGTIRENITFLSGDVSDEQVEKAARQAVIYDFIASLPDGFDTVIGERGLGLSEGQLQRIAIARALLCDAPVLLLDECTSALDAATELALLENLKSQKDKTVILITHRTAALDICDTVLRVEDCKIC
ncbi:MAG: ABC transporter ATP-binding protein [Clostridia bacterium]|nr:ABC transporter ATP-binding protein [Clostridia bacterium]